jgi:Ca2+-binding RTX toxin-like protein
VLFRSLTGGTGKDQFVFDDFSSGGDVVTDFKHGEDKLYFDELRFGLSNDYKLQLVDVTEPVAKTAGPTFLYETDTHRLWFDADGKGGDAETCLVATLNGVKSLSASDFAFF